MNDNGKMRSICELIEINRDDQALDVIGGNGHDDFTGHGEFDENDPRSIAYMQRRADRNFISSTWEPKTRNYLTLADLFKIKVHILSAMRFTRSKDAIAEMNEIKRIVLRALGETESEQT